MDFLRELVLKFDLHILDCFKSVDFGPLDYIDTQIRSVHLNRSKSAFSGAFYATVRPRDKPLSLHKLCGRYSSRNLFCLAESEATRNAFLKENAIVGYSLRVPASFKFFCGRASQKTFGKVKNMVVAFVPDEYLRLLIESQDSRKFDEKTLQEAFLSQCKFFRKFYLLNFIFF
jgi:hypothetical protein